MLNVVLQIFNALITEVPMVVENLGNSRICFCIPETQIYLQNPRFFRLVSAFETDLT